MIAWYYVVLIAIACGVVGFLWALLSVQTKYDKLYSACGTLTVTVDKRGVEHYNLHVDDLDTLINRKYALFIMDTPDEKPRKYIPYEELVEEVDSNEKT